MDTPELNRKVLLTCGLNFQTATVIALCNMVDFDLEKEHIQAAIMDAGNNVKQD